MTLAETIIAAVCDRATLPRLPAFLRGRRVIEIGLAYRMADDPPFAGRHRLVPDAWTGRRGVVVRIPRDDPPWRGAATRPPEQANDPAVEIELANGGGVFVHHESLRTVHADGSVTPSVAERRWPDAIERGRASR